MKVKGKKKEYALKAINLRLFGTLAAYSLVERMVGE